VRVCCGQPLYGLRIKRRVTNWNKVQRSTNDASNTRQSPNIHKHVLLIKQTSQFNSSYPTPLSHNTLYPPLYSIAMAPKPASTASKAPHPAAASKAPAKTTEGKKAAKKTSKAPADGEKKKRKKARKETYSSYIYKGACSLGGWWVMGC